ncbi:substrate-binding domain-containing protein [Ketogulonicigenium vulgare]|uniref:substrate-binding domain-containing protein n=1 Tax=Ketogulonicigenium vulgare TaxID=92945 RepID=UPI0001E68049|nr:substrate-binding domain-containing protein [Ketogulonicigenium vulgare]ADO41623.1 ABC transporter, substrate binding protein (sugar) [Ketogulonicigenium vulgare Y25]ALJ80079.1 sugar ABC transporter substrate-binding protein [Ketogulonicigenium vulgare]ANW34869.1 sugar ABC transporter substrate-binding protein [Ketogulonicigenium vulgare]AOZ53554.1 sugar ABC transporter substrate-binding protein [Ketogulonicigenium vulgare]
MKKHFTLAAVSVIALSSAAYAQDSFTIGLSNGFVGSEWRTQMIEEAQAAAAAWGEQGVNVEVIVQSGNVDVQGQIGHIRNFINQGVDAIIINPQSPTAFDPVFAQAAEAGILVIATDAEVTSPDAIYVGIDQKAWAYQSADWLAKALNGEGNVVTINGVAGNPANEARVAGYTEAFAQYPGITVLNQANANWDQAQGQQVMQNLLATYPNLNGVWVQDGMADGAWRAIEAAGRTTDIAATGEIRKDFMERWSELGLNSGASVNPPGVMGSALNVAVLRLQGREFRDDVFTGANGNAIYIPIPFVDNDNLADSLAAAEGQPGYWSVTDIVTPEEAAEFFQ